MASNTENTTGRRIRAVEISYKILAVIRQGDNSTLSEIADKLGHSKSTIYSHLQTLIDQEIIVQEEDGYRLGLKTLDMANDLRNQFPNYDIIVNEVDELAERSGETSQFGIIEHEKLAYLYKSRGENAVETASSIGQKHPLHSTSLGKSILAYLPGDKTKEIIDSIELSPQNENTITDPEELYDELETIFERGYAIDDEENINGIRCVSAAVKNDDNVVGAISITKPASSITDERLHGELAESVQRSANVIELNTKFSGRFAKSSRLSSN